MAGPPKRRAVKNESESSGSNSEEGSYSGQEVSFCIAYVF